MPFGVELPENFGDSAQPTEDKAPDTAPESAEAPDTQGQEQPDLVDVKSLERFRYGDKEFTPAELEKLLEGNQAPRDQGAVQTEKFHQNFAFDLETVIADPRRFAEFRQIYPAEFVQRATSILKRAGVAVDTADRVRSPEQAQSTTETQLPEWAKELKQWKDELAQERQEQRVAKAESFLDKQFEKLGQKYPLANPRACNAQAMVVASSGRQVTAEVLEKIFKQEHSDASKLYERHHRTNVEAQKSANSLARDVGVGGSLPSQSAEKPRTLKEATHRLLADMEAAK